MERSKEMNNNRIALLITIVALILAICVPAVYKINKAYNEKLISVVETKIKEKAHACIIDTKCQEPKIYLQTLYDLNYLSELVNPVTKEYYNPQCYVEKKNNNYQFIEIKK